VTKYRIVQTHEYSYATQQQYLGFFWYTLYRSISLEKAISQLNARMATAKAAKEQNKFVKRVVHSKRGM
jgi:hypothetical protein